jgi:hypothetical protein
MVLEDRKVTIIATAQNLNVTHWSVYEVVYDSLGLHKICASWVPRQAVLYGHLLLPLETVS